jgi:alkylation response protein AidB-like acyl-CoA dehydrogenase
MDFTFTPEQEALRREFEEFFSKEEKNAPPGWVGGWESRYETDENWAYHRSVTKKLAQKGWLSLAWPKEYGGQEHSHVEQAIFGEVFEYHRVPAIDINLLIVGPGILAFGSDELKKEWLPKMAKGEIVFCQGWSEPNAGSDLASLTTRAVEDGDDYILNGQKIWTTGGHRADHIFILARTDPTVKKSKGLTYFLSEINRPGITVRPLYYMNRAHVYKEVFLDNVRIPKKNIVGGINQGWLVTMAGVNFERSGTGGIAAIRRDFEELVKFCRETSYRGQPLGKDPIIKHRLAQLAIEIEAARQWAWYVVWLQSRDPLGTIAEPSASKYFLSDLTVRMANVAVDAMGLYGTVRQGSKWAQLYGKFESMCQINLGATIAGGSDETQKNIIAWMKLGLPRT